MKSFLILAALAAAAAAGDRPPILEATGSDLATFSVRFHASAIDHSSAEALAASFAECEVEADRVQNALGTRIIEALAALGERYFAPEGAKVMRASAERVRNRAAPVCTVSAVHPSGENAAVGFLQETSPHGSTALRLHMARTGKSWIVESVEVSDGHGGFQRRGLAPPPKPPAVDVPAAVPPDLSSATATVESLRAEMHRLTHLRARGFESLYAPYFAILKAFYGEAAAKKSRAEQKPASPEKQFSYVIHADAPGADGTVRVHATALEKAPNGKGDPIPVGEAAFDLRKDASNEWRVVAEFERPKRNGPLRERKGGLCLLLFH